MRNTHSIRRGIIEVLERRVLLSAPPQKFVLPIGGTPGVDWAITAYTDREPLAGVALDYRGRQYTFDGSTGIHFALPEFATMDRGIDVYAVAPGKVMDVHDGEFDRVWQTGTVGLPDNYVLIDHGDGWQTRYARLRNGSVSVSPGQVVTGGQVIGQVGGSGDPSPIGPNYQQSPARLVFTVTKDGTFVEPMLDPAAFWVSPPPYAGDTPGLHNMSPNTTPPTQWDEAWEGLPVRRVFHRNERVYPMAKFHGRNREALWGYRYFRPDGSQIVETPNTQTSDWPQSWRGTYLQLGSAPQLGTWQVAIEADGVELGRTSFLVADPSQGLPEIKVYQGSAYVLDGRTTPLDFGSVTQDGGAAGRAFTVYNYGTQPLLISQVTLPEGFAVQTPLPSSIAAGSFGTMVVRLNDDVAGPKSGQVIIYSNDADQGEFDFAVKGNVIGLPPTVIADQFLYESAPQRLQFTFSQNVITSLSAADLIVQRLEPPTVPVTVSEPVYDPVTNTATFAIDSGGSVLPDGNYRATLSGAGITNGGTPMTADFVMDFFVLAGDANRDRTVNLLDFNILAANFGQSNRTFSQGDFNYDGAVNLSDFNILASRFGTSLAPDGRVVGAVNQRLPAIAWASRVDGGRSLFANGSGEELEDLAGVLT